MSSAEYADVTENVLSPSIGLAGLLNNASYKDYIRSLSVSDSRHVRLCNILTTVYASRSPTNHANAQPVHLLGHVNVASSFL